MMEENSFELIQQFEDKIAEMPVRKYVYHFTDKRENKDIINMIARMKHQLQESPGIFAEVYPVYVSINLGRDLIPSVSLPQDKFYLVMREGFSLGGSQHMVSILHEEVTNSCGVIRVMSIDEQTNETFGFDLSEEDQILLGDNIAKLREPDYIAKRCQIITNTLMLVQV